MSDAALAEVIAECEQLREELPPRARFTDADFVHDLAGRLKQTKTLSRQTVTQCFIADAEKFEPGQPLQQTKRHINEATDTHLFSLFNASYFPALSLDYLVYDPLPINETLAEAFPGPTTPVTLRRRSRGFASRIVVALFPENHIDGVQRSEDRIFYFIDKFIERYRRITCTLLREIVADDALPLVRNATDAQAERAATYWVCLHEYHHRHGDMPLPEFLPTKSLKPLAGLEELRADVSGMLACLSHPGLPADEAAMAYEFILAERLLRYSVEGAKRPNYDGVASQVLFNYLRAKDGIRLQDGIIHLRPRLPEVLAEILGHIHEIEGHIATESPEAVQRRLLEFANSYAVVDEESHDYRHIPYFEQVKDRLGV